jgi:hypothetical protein
MISKTLRLSFFSVLVTAVFSTACTVSPGSSGSSAGSKTRGQMDGPITSGGGNGLDGRMTEMYSKDIQSLPEYRRYIVPVLRRLSQNRTDVLVAYLRWAANSKAWYFVPERLPNLPKERIALAFKSTDQLALHSDKEIFIDEPAYRAQTDREKAFLLLHEMVMGARLLMKKSPVKQCSILSGSLESSSCKDPEIMKLATMDADFDPKQEQIILNGRDHESVRAMTVYLMEPKRALDGASIAALRSRLEFNFPWDHLLSSLDQDQLIAAIDRSVLARTAFTAPPSFASKVDSDCYLSQKDLSSSYLSYELGNLAGPNAEEKGLGLSVQLQRDRPLALVARGVSDPKGSGQIVDLVEIEPFNLWASVQRAPNVGVFKFRYQFYISRGPQPTVLEYRLIPVEVRSQSDYYNGISTQEYESIAIKGLQPFRCVSK